MEVKVECNLGNTIACSLQSWDWLENRRSKDDKISRRVWEAVETKAGKIRMEKAKRRRKEARREGTEEERKEKTKKGKNNGNEEGSRRIGDLG